MSTREEIKRERATKKAIASRMRCKARKDKTFWQDDHFSATVDAHHAQEQQEKEDELQLLREYHEFLDIFDAYIEKMLWSTI